MVGGRWVSGGGRWLVVGDRWLAVGGTWQVVSGYGGGRRTCRDYVNSY